MMSNSTPKGLLLLHKKPGLTSFESLGMVKKALHTGKVGHTGTLDKFASGLLLTLIGQAGKLASLFSFCHKEYEGCIRFGGETDTLDPEGEIIAEAGLPSRETVEGVLSGFRGDILQAPPAYSAIHINGVRAHELSRQGKTPEMRKRPIIISELTLVSWEPPFAGIRVRCSAGTYIRSLARDIAIAAGSRAHLTALARTRIGNFFLKDAFDPDAFTDADMADAVSRAVLPVAPEIFTSLELPWVYAREEQLALLVHGQSLESPTLKGLTADLPPARAAGIFGRDNSLAAVLEHSGGKWNYQHVFGG